MQFDILLVSVLYCFLLNIKSVFNSLEDHCVVVEIEKFLFPSVMFKTKLVALKLVTANNNFPSSDRFKRSEKEKNLHLLIQ